MTLKFQSLLSSSCGQNVLMYNTNGQITGPAQCSGANGDLRPCFFFLISTPFIFLKHICLNENIIISAAESELQS